MSRLPPTDPNSYQSRKLSQPHLIARSSTDPQYSAPVHYIREKKRSILVPVLSLFGVCMALLLLVFMENRKATKQGQNLSHATAKAVNAVGQKLGGVLQRQDTADTKLDNVDGQVQTLKKRVNKVENRVVVHDGAIKDLKGKVLLPRDYDPKVPLTDNARIHHIGPTIEDWTLKVDKLGGGKARIEVAPIRVTHQGTEVYAIKGNSSVPVEAGGYYLIDSGGQLKKSR